MLVPFLFFAVKKIYDLQENEKCIMSISSNVTKSLTKFYNYFFHVNLNSY